VHAGPGQQDNEGVLLGNLGVDIGDGVLTFHEDHTQVIQEGIGIFQGLGNAFAGEIEGVEGLGQVQEVGIVAGLTGRVFLLNFRQDLSSDFRRTGLARRLALFLLTMAFSSFWRVSSKNSADSRKSSFRSSCRRAADCTPSISRTASSSSRRSAISNSQRSESLSS